MLNEPEDYLARLQQTTARMLDAIGCCLKRPFSLAAERLFKASLKRDLRAREIARAALELYRGPHS